MDPRGTSHTCPVCGINKKANRPKRDLFKCISCGFAGPADKIAAINIAARAKFVNKPIVACETETVFCGDEVKHSYKPPISMGSN
ncbi:unnamed protein product [marine sediment metagenome]|uniref:Cas12f1-like TNB domain-containing protein n=1 Tax=marine sediment metagenome TaxID=412755 RepID=X1EHR5_9ZZZZ